jgi:lysophospholipase L1-like esterase
VQGRRLTRRALLTAGAAVTIAAASPAALGAPPRVHTAGRVRRTADGYLAYSWPGVSFEGRFRGTGVGVVLDDTENDYDVLVDSTTAATLVTPGRTTHWITGLSDTEHHVRLVKRTESPWAAGRFGGFTTPRGGALLPPPRARRRQIEFIGDSFTVGYGNTSDTRDCSTNGGVARNTNADLSFGALTARDLGADYQINAFSGLGMVRNYGGHSPGTDFRTYYDRALLHLDGDVWRVPGSWRPDVIVIGLGLNDFSTPVGPDEPWTPDSLVAAYREAYHGFLDTLRARYGRRAYLLVSATSIWNTTVFAETAEEIVRDRNRQGDGRVGYWYYDDPRLDRLGCDWHPSLADHRIVSGLLHDHLAGLPLDW